MVVLPVDAGMWVHHGLRVCPAFTNHRCVVSYTRTRREVCEAEEIAFLQLNDSIVNGFACFTGIAVACVVHFASLSTSG
jgi:hypothetical protein